MSLPGKNSAITQEDVHHRISSLPSLKWGSHFTSSAVSPASIVLDTVPPPSAIGLDSRTQAHTPTHTHTYTAKKDSSYIALVFQQIQSDISLVSISYK